MPKVLHTDTYTTVRGPKHYAYVNTHNNTCSKSPYSTIQSTSEPKTNAQITQEVATLLESGVQELIITNQHTTCCIVSQLVAILHDTRHFSIRLTNLYPQMITDELITLMQQDARILAYVEVVINHHTLNSAGHTLTKLRQSLPHITISAHIVVESPDELMALSQFISETPFENIRSTISNTIPRDLTKTLLEQQLKLVTKRNTQFIGLQIEVVVEGYHPESRLLMRGCHDGQCPEIDGSVIINDGRKVTAFGKKYLVEITDVSDYDLIGRII